MMQHLIRPAARRPQDLAVPIPAVPTLAVPTLALPTLAMAGAILLGLSACQPTVRVEAPREPITINLNIKLDADVRVRLEEKAREDITSNPEIF